ncbi:MAG: caspase family protein [Salaquimonas sp.]|nr:caspase family protein [Salaquimonas sp.]
MALAIATVWLLGAAGAAQAEKRVALVIGNSKYVHASELKNPANDANAIAASLADLDFHVIKGVDLDQNGMRAKIQEFARSINNAQVALLFYAGHGLQVDGQNYLLPINAELSNEIDLQFQGVAVDFLLRVMENRNRTSIVLLDACRNNPLAARLARSMSKGRAANVSQGLARIETGVGTYIGFSTSPDNVALDGDGDNSPFTTALLKHIGTEDEDIESVMRNVREDVIKATNGNQVPWGNSSLVGRGFVFKTADDKKTEEKVASAEPAKPQPQADLAAILQNLANQGNTRSTADTQVEMTYWESIEKSTDPRFFKAYLEQFPNGSFTSLARLKIALLEGKQPENTASKVEPAKPAAEPAAPVAKIEKPATPVVKAEEPKKPEPVAKTATNTPPKADEHKEIQVASLPARETPSVNETAVEDTGPTPEMLKSLQSELNRVGCDAGGVDGIWGRRSQSALEDFVSRRGLEIASIEPSGDILEKLKSVDERVCPLVCGHGFVKKGDICERIIVKRKPTVNKKTATIFSIRKTSQRPTVQFKNGGSAIQNNRHMPRGLDSDGGQM